MTRSGLLAAAVFAATLPLAQPAFAASEDEAAQGADASAQSVDSQDTPDDNWHVTLTPRFQKLFFKPESADLEPMNNFGLSATVRSPDQRFGFAGLYLRGNKENGRYLFDDTTTYEFDLKRKEFALSFEYTPRETGVTFIAGYHHFDIRQNETAVDSAPAFTETNTFSTKISLAEVGIRLSSRLGANSRQSVSAQFMAGVGNGRFKFTEDYRAGGATFLDSGNDKGAAYFGEVALGYNIFLTDAISIGARARGYVFDVRARGADAIFALAPELNFSVRF